METTEKIKQLLYSVDRQNRALALELMKGASLTWEHPKFQAEKELVDWWGIDIFGYKTLSLKNNQLQSLPEAIGQLKNLELLYLRDNQLSSLPASIGQLRQLKKLWLQGNPLSSLPAAIGQLQQLKTLWLEGNPLSNTAKEELRKQLPNISIQF